MFHNCIIKEMLLTGGSLGIHARQKVAAAGEESALTDGCELREKRTRKREKTLNCDELLACCD